MKLSDIKNGNIIEWYENINWNTNPPEITVKPIKYSGILKLNLMNGWQVKTKFGNLNLRDIIKL